MVVPCLRAKTALFSAGRAGCGRADLRVESWRGPAGRRRARPHRAAKSARKLELPRSARQMRFELTLMLLGHHGGAARRAGRSAVLSLRQAAGCAMAELVAQRGRAWAKRSSATCRHALVPMPSAPEGQTCWADVAVPDEPPTTVLKMMLIPGRMSQTRTQRVRRESPSGKCQILSTRWRIDGRKRARPNRLLHSSRHRGARSAAASAAASAASAAATGTSARSKPPPERFRLLPSASARGCRHRQRQRPRARRGLKLRRCPVHRRHLSRRPNRHRHRRPTATGTAARAAA